jgi:hypothetical protein
LVYVLRCGLYFTYMADRTGYLWDTSTGATGIRERIGSAFECARCAKESVWTLRQVVRTGMVDEMEGNTEVVILRHGEGQRGLKLKLSVQLNESSPVTSKSQK